MSEILENVLGCVAGLKGYVPGVQPQGEGWVKLNTNESPYGPSPRVREAILEEIGKDGMRMRLYPEPMSLKGRECVARVLGNGLRAENVILGNGSDDILNLVMRVFGGKDRGVGFTVPSYSLYPVLLAIQDGKAEPVEFGREMKLPVEKMAASGARAFVLTSPNAPTGVGFSNAEIEEVLKRFKGVLVVDEAYAPFAKENAVELLKRYPRLMILRTMSKAHALAGLRLGYAVGSAEMIEILDRVRDSYNVNRLSQAAFVAALEDGDYYAGVIGKIQATREWFSEFLREELGWFTYRSEANFVFTEPKDAKGRTGAAVAKGLYEFLLKEKVLVRYFGSHALTESFLRVSVGTDDEMKVVQKLFSKWLKTIAV